MKNAPKTRNFKHFFLNDTNLAVFHIWEQNLRDLRRSPLQTHMLPEQILEVWNKKSDPRRERFGGIASSWKEGWRDPKTVLPSLKLTFSKPENGWLEYDCFLLGWPIFRCYASFRSVTPDEQEQHHYFPAEYTKKKWFCIHPQRLAIKMPAEVTDTHKATSMR